jgi:hypothetical protein
MDVDLDDNAQAVPDFEQFQEPAPALDFAPFVPAPVPTHAVRFDDVDSDDEIPKTPRRGHALKVPRSRTVAAKTPRVSVSDQELVHAMQVLSNASPPFAFESRHAAAEEDSMDSSDSEMPDTPLARTPTGEPAVVDDRTQLSMPVDPASLRLLMREIAESVMETKIMSEVRVLTSSLMETRQDLDEEISLKVEKGVIKAFARFGIRPADVQPGLQLQEPPAALTYAPAEQLPQREVIEEFGATEGDGFQQQAGLDGQY